MSPVSLSTLRKGARGVVVDVRDDAQSLGDEAQSTVSRRLLELGFVPGEAFEVIEEIWPGGDPMAVRLGNTTFALRRREAGAVLVEPRGRLSRACREQPAADARSDASRARRRAELRQDRAVQPPDRQPPDESPITRASPSSARKARSPARRPAAPVQGARPAGRLQPHADHARRSDHARLPARPARRRAAARVRRLRRRRHQPAAQPAAGARTARPRRADDRRAQHERPRARAAATGSTARGSSRNSACRSSRPWRCDHGGERALRRASSRRCRSPARAAAVAWREPTFDADPAARSARCAASCRRSATRSPRASARSRASTRS